MNFIFVSSSFLQNFSGVFNSKHAMRFVDVHSKKKKERGTICVHWRISKDERSTVGKKNNNNCGDTAGKHKCASERLPTFLYSKEKDLGFQVEVQGRSKTEAGHKARKL